MSRNVLVIKVGGAAGVDRTACAVDIARLKRPVVLVFGVSAAVDALCAERGLPVRTLTSPTGHTSRYTDLVTRDMFVETARRIGSTWTELLGQHGAAAQAVTPLSGERKTALRTLDAGRLRIVRDDYSGIVTQVDCAAVQDVLQSGRIAVIAPLANSTEGLLNVDGDRAGAALAGALGASEYLILSTVRGLYRCFPDEHTFVPQVQRPDHAAALDWAQGRMKRKVIGALEALAGGVQRVIIGDGRGAHPVQRALSGAGTEFLA